MKESRVLLRSGKRKVVWWLCGREEQRVNLVVFLVVSGGEEGGLVATAADDGEERRKRCCPGDCWRGAALVIVGEADAACCPRKKWRRGRRGKKRVCDARRFSGRPVAFWCTGVDVPVARQK
ncbi:hypothetical protein HAX54_002938 [Datura stramonium]|uniref:Uncharacterized protein n=1 Tax=Datura stramonium TaxID=4076 RepID=A0ABS8WRP4_DATST|nr:hypothetical protein [Datura stramonium]